MSNAEKRTCNHQYDTACQIPVYPTKVAVSVGAADCKVINHTDTEIRCRLGHTKKGSYYHSELVRYV